ncbi:MAG: type II and III secretion system protein family protein [Terriglobia bacterium]
MAAAPDQMHLLVGRSSVIEFAQRIRRVSIANPAICDALIVSPRQMLLNGKAPGNVSVVVWRESGNSQTFDVSVDLNIGELAQRIHEIFPGEPVEVESAEDVITLSGRASSKTEADQIAQLATAVTPKVVNLIESPAPPSTGEILLAVKFAEVDQTAIQQLGANLISLAPSKMVGSTSTQQFSPPQLLPQTPLTAANSAFTLSDLLNVFLFRPDLNLAATIEALEQKNLLQILAEPNLLTETGKPASFLAGGEFPFPVVQGGTSFTSVTIQFKEFGVRLNFTPTILPDGMIHLHVQPEVSSLDFADGLTVSGFQVPALTTRRVDSEMDLRDGQSFAIAGLVDNRVTQSLEKIPGIGDIPVLGKLFQSRSVNKTKTQLLVVVTPYIVHPGKSRISAPKFPLPFIKDSKSRAPRKGPAK